MDNQLRLLADPDPTLADAAETIYAAACEIGRLTYVDRTLDVIEKIHRIRVLEGQKGEAETTLAPHVPPATWILVGHAGETQWELYRNPHTGRISSTPYRPEPEPDDVEDLEDIGGWNP